MWASVDDAGRVMIPGRLLGELGLLPVPVEVVRADAAAQIEPATDNDLVELVPRLVIPAGGEELTDEDVQALRYADDD